MIASALEARERFLADPKLSSVLDIGSGEGNHAAAFLQAGLRVTTVDHVHDHGLGCEHHKADFNDFMIESLTEGRQWSGIWCSHVLEHTLDPHSFLCKIFDLLEDDGLLGITVPPLKHQIVGGHINLFNEGMLLYRLILAGFDCRAARVGVYGYNISVLVRKSEAHLPELHMDAGDIERLAQFFPVPAAQNFNGQIGSINW